MLSKARPTLGVQLNEKMAGEARTRSILHNCVMAQKS